MIQNFSADNLVWRLTRVIGLTENGPPLSVMPQAFHLSKISAWERGGEPVLAANGCESAMPQIIRLTVDSRGLQRVERLQEKPAHRPGRSESKAFAVFDERDVRGAVLWFKSGLGRLTSGECKSRFAIPIWDTPTPPTRINLPPMVERCWTVELEQGELYHFYGRRGWHQGRSRPYGWIIPLCRHCAQVFESLPMDIRSYPTRRQNHGMS